MRSFEGPRGSHLVKVLYKDSFGPLFCVLYTSLSCLSLSRDTVHEFTDRLLFYLFGLLFSFPEDIFVRPSGLEDLTDDSEG